MNKQLIYYITGNQSKFLSAQNNLLLHDITIQQKTLDIPEIQASTTMEVAVDKATKAFAKVKQPLLVSDHGWHIDAFNGFPGPYMRYINEWLEPEHFLALMDQQENRLVTLRQSLVYIDGQTTQSFSHDIQGYVLRSARGTLGTNWDKVVCLTDDNKSVAESREATGKRSVLIDEPEPWASFATWYKENVT